jgi:plastocyanin
MKLPNPNLFLALGLAVALAACGSDKATNASSSADNSAAAAPATTPEPSSSAAPATGNVIEVLATTEGDGTNHFVPSQLTAKRGDVIRVKLGTGVHNFHITEGPAGATLPAAGAFLQIPGQTEDVALDLPAGDYKFQCDPHAALGMTGTLTVTE